MGPGPEPEPAEQPQKGLLNKANAVRPTMAEKRKTFLLQKVPNSEPKPKTEPRVLSPATPYQWALSLPPEQPQARLCAGSSGLCGKVDSGSPRRRGDSMRDYSA